MPFSSNMGMLLATCQSDFVGKTDCGPELRVAVLLCNSFYGFWRSGVGLTRKKQCFLATTHQRNLRFAVGEIRRTRFFRHLRVGL